MLIKPGSTKSPKELLMKISRFWRLGLISLAWSMLGSDYEM